jgi:uncharacterized protein with GYD domain
MRIESEKGQALIADCFEIVPVCAFGYHKLETTRREGGRGRKLRMAYYLLQSAYTTEGWAALVRNPEDDRTDAVRSVIEQLGGTVHGGWLAFGEYDTVFILEMPDNTRAAASSAAFAGNNAIKDVKTTPLMTYEEGVEALRAAAGTTYRSPGG